MKTFECPKGHVLKVDEPFGCKAHSPSGESWEQDKTLLDSGPLCQVCYVEWMKEQFPTKEITGVER